MTRRSRLVWKYVGGLAAATAAGLIGVVLCIFLTPVWWKLEGIIGFELAGHSGPRDGLLIAFALGFAGLGFAISAGRRR